MSKNYLQKLSKALAKDNGISEEVVELPSNKSRATIRPMKVKEHKQILKAFEKKNEYLINQAFDELLERCVISIDGEPFNSDELIIQDRIFLLVKIRQLSTGDKIKIVHVDEKTNEVKDDIEIDISKLKVDYFEGELTKEMDLSPSIKLVFGPLKRKQEKELELYSRQNDNSLIDKQFGVYASIIDKVILKTNDEDGNVTNEVAELSFEEKLQFIVDAFTEKNIEVLKDYIRSLDFGIRLKLNYQDDEGVISKEDINIISFFIRS